MSRRTNAGPPAPRRGERGGARLNLVVVLAVITVAAYSGYQYIPVAYQASLFKVYMQDTVDKAVATGKDTAWVESQLKTAEADYDVPPDAVFRVEKREGRIEASARWTRPVNFPGYTYAYEFDHTVRSTNFLKPD